VNFSEKVFQITRNIPRGHVATYGQIAAVMGQPRAARTVGWALARSEPDVPWHRVVNRHGMISIENIHVTKDTQARNLREEGIQVFEREGNYWVDLNVYLVDSAQLGH
jgi:methylated-DNA-protein-cysteine methyltransferase-like protein